MKRITFLIAVLLAVSFSTDSYAFDDGDFQYWNTESASWKFEEGWKIKIEEEFRFADDVSDFYYQHSDIGFSYLAENWLELGANYRHIFEEISGDWKKEYRPHLNATLKADIDGADLSNRSRLEYRNKEDSDESFRYRNKTTLKVPSKMTKYEIQPYLADEIFVDFDAGELNTNRFYVGAAFNIYKKLKGDIYYLWQTKKSSGSWIDYYIVGTKLNLSF